jgi:hypothetical protein
LSSRLQTSTIPATSFIPAGHLLHSLPSAQADGAGSRVRGPRCSEARLGPPAASSARADAASTDASAGSRRFPPSSTALVDSNRRTVAARGALPAIDPGRRQPPPSPARPQRPSAASFGFVASACFRARFLGGVGGGGDERVDAPRPRERSGKLRGLHSPSRGGIHGPAGGNCRRRMRKGHCHLLDLLLYPTIILIWSVIEATSGSKWSWTVGMCRTHVFKICVFLKILTIKIRYNKFKKLRTWPNTFRSNIYKSVHIIYVATRNNTNTLANLFIWDLGKLLQNLKEDATNFSNLGYV